MSESLSLLDQARLAADGRLQAFKLSCQIPSFERLNDAIGADNPDKEKPLVALLKSIAKELDPMAQKLVLMQIPRGEKIDQVLKKMREKKMLGIKTAMLAAEAAKLTLKALEVAEPQNDLAILEVQVRLEQAETAIALASNGPEWAMIMDEIGQVAELAFQMFGGVDGLKAAKSSMASGVKARFSRSNGGSPGDEAEGDANPESESPQPGDEQEFRYEAMNQAGEEVTGEISARNEKDALAKIRAEGNFPTRLRSAKTAEAQTA